MKDIRNAAFSGMFYPDNKQELQLELKKQFSQVPTANSEEDILGVISPHAGYYYSGNCAAHSYQALAQKNFKTAIIIAPSHKYNHFAFSVGDYEAYQTPLGKIPVNSELVGKLLGRADFEFLPQVHAVEHSLEVQLPFLQFLDKEINLVPILTGAQTRRNSKYLAQELKKIISQQAEDFVVIISSDLSHYHSSRNAMIMDKRLMDYVGNLEAERLEDESTLHRLEACGLGGILTMIYLAKELGYQAKHLKYSHSGEVNGDNNQVVGYLASLFYR